MKRHIIIILIALTIGIPSAMAQFRYGPSLGLNISTLKFSQKLVPVNGTVGAEAGVRCEMMFPGIGFGVDFGLFYDLQGAKVDLGSKKVWASQGYGRETTLLHNLAVPLDLRFKWTRMNGFEEFMAPFVFGGPVFSVNVAHSDIKAFSYNVATFGLQAGLGFELMKDWQIQASYLWNITNSLHTRLLDDYNAAVRGWNVSVVRYF